MPVAPRGCPEVYRCPGSSPNMNSENVKHCLATLSSKAEALQALRAVEERVALAQFKSSATMPAIEKLKASMVELLEVWYFKGMQIQITLERNVVEDGQGDKDTKNQHEETDEDEHGDEERDDDHHADACSDE